jgi:hypothetical protein
MPSNSRSCSPFASINSPRAVSSASRSSCRGARFIKITNTTEVYQNEKPDCCITKRCHPPPLLSASVYLYDSLMGGGARFIPAKRIQCKTTSVPGINRARTGWGEIKPEPYDFGSVPRRCLISMTKTTAVRQTMPPPTPSLPLSMSMSQSISLSLSLSLSLSRSLAPGGGARFI